MTSAAQGDVVVLSTAGVSSGAQTWRGGHGVLLVSAPSGTPDFEMQLPDGTWVPVKSLNNETPAISDIAAAGMWNFCLPACKIRLNNGTTATAAWAIGV